MQEKSYSVVAELKQVWSLMGNCIFQRVIIKS